MRPPSIDVVARSLADTGLPHALCVEVAREAVAADDPESAHARAIALRRALLQPVVNATGVLLHTNLGRAPYDMAAGPGYHNLELDLGSGSRGSRDAHAAGLIAQLVGSEAGLVVNNGASALLLVLRAIAAGGSVVVSRGELVEIGGGFRIPEILAESGARLIEVGTTNRTTRDDYVRALADADPPVAAILKVHPSNYHITGFTSSVSVGELVGVGVPVVADIGSGLLDAHCPWLAGPPPSWLANEPAARQTLQAGASLVTFSGDKLLGGPQAGFVVGSRSEVERCRRVPLARAVRAGGHVLHGVQQLALAYLRRDGQSIPFWRMATVDCDALADRAQRIVDTVGADVSVVDTTATIGGGSVPGTGLASVGVAVDGDVVDQLRSNDMPVLARMVDQRTVLDLRTVDPAEDGVVAAAVAAVVGSKLGPSN